ncbi:peptidase inhibitor family I36 protein [Herbidospora yilanensis]|uniref:peptidase inhibitor family I36 protein n=1 Tax=Herbidospora yilanensis TaxID=354426 RepID=UPI0009FC6841|nr:peptidase inhibitor family I36 protein [Herbidospora yilanensis]
MAAPAPASAAQTDLCYPGYICFYPQANFQGEMTSHYNPWWGNCGHIPGGGTARSVVNNDDQTWIMYAGEYGRKVCAGPDIEVPPGTSNADLGFDATNWN